MQDKEASEVFDNYFKDCEVDDILSGVGGETPHLGPSSSSSPVVAASEKRPVGAGKRPFTKEQLAKVTSARRVTFSDDIDSAPAKKASSSRRPTVEEEIDSDSGSVSLDEEEEPETEDEPSGETLNSDDSDDEDEEEVPKQKSRTSSKTTPASKKATATVTPSTKKSTLLSVPPRSKSVEPASSSPPPPQKSLVEKTRQIEMAAADVKRREGELTAREAKLKEALQEMRDLKERLTALHATHQKTLALIKSEEVLLDEKRRSLTEAEQKVASTPHLVGQTDIMKRRPLASSNHANLEHLAPMAYEQLVNRLPKTVVEHATLLALNGRHLTTDVLIDRGNGDTLIIEIVDALEGRALYTQLGDALLF